ncbi:MAG: DegT/DnrJ/EryC1/StrS family aminotransferase [Treponemataceae bacterium]
MMIKSFSSHIQRKEMEAVLSCMVSEKIGPGDLNARLVQEAKEFFCVSGASAFRSPSIALKYALQCIGLEAGNSVIVSALAPFWHYQTLVDLGFAPVVVDVSADTAQMNTQAIEEAVQSGGKAILLYEPLGFLPNESFFINLGIPIIEDISQNAGSFFLKSIKDDEQSVEVKEKKRFSGSFFTYAIVGLEEKDIITAGGGALLLASKHREWVVQKNLVDRAVNTDILPDINSSLAFVQFKEFKRSEAIRKEMKELYIRSIMQGKHKTVMQSPISEDEDAVSVCYSFPVILSGNFKDVKQYALRKDIEVVLAFEGSIIAVLQDEITHCTQAQSLYLRCVLFPLYPRLGMKNAAKISKVLSTLP